MKEKRNVTRSGVKFKGKTYWSDKFKDIIGAQVIVSFDEKKDCLMVYKDHEFICEANVVGINETKDITRGIGDMFGFRKKLEDYKTEDLIKEIVTRKNTSILKMDKNQQYQVKNGQKRIKEKGPATILVIR